MPITLIVAATLLASVFPAAAQSWPGRPITIVVPFAAGGASVRGVIRTCDCNSMISPERSRTSRTLSCGRDGSGSTVSPVVQRQLRGACE